MTTTTDTGITVPVLFHIHDGEATGTVLPFCGAQCRQEYTPETDVTYATGEGSTLDFAAEPVCTECAMPLTVDAYVARIMAEVDDQVELGYISQGERLDDESIQRCLNGDRAGAEEHVDSMSEDNRHYYITQAIEEAASSAGLDTDDLAHEVTDRLREAISERDTFDLFGGLLRSTGRRMFRLKIVDPSDPDEHLYGETYWDSSDTDRAAQAATIAGALGWGDEHHDFILGILAETSYAGTHPSILWYGDVDEMVDALHDQEFQEATHTITFDAGAQAALLMWDGLNGSGFEGNPLPAAVTLPLRSDLIDLDHRAGPGYSYSDDVAGLVYSAFETDPTITKASA